jgi:cobalt-zinc-cadmium efflux system outer membrane protein
MRHSLARVAQSDALLKLAEADKLGNLTLGGGVRHASASDELSGLAAISFPIPVFDRREDAIAEMTALAEKARLELDGTRRELETEFTLAWSDLIAAHQAARLIQTELLPASTEAFHSAEKSFRGGKITALEYLAARQQFQDIRRQWLDARREFHLAATRVQTLTGRSL